ncbi:MAG: 4-aminobutyrate aminotransferase/(S)-3-amino-2-methylpropionate transaminase [Myxococcota bacterium]
MQVSPDVDILEVFKFQVQEAFMSVPPERSSQSLLDRRAAVVARGVPIGTGLAIRSARGAVLVDVSGREVLDFASGIGVMSVGHSNPAVIEAIVTQAAELQHVCMHISTYEGYVALCERLTSLLPHGGPTKAMLVNSGAEAVENAVKIARQATGRPAVICYTGAFHGRTLLAMTLTAKVAYKTGCGPFASEVYRIPFPSLLRRGDIGPEAFVELELERLRHTFKETVVGNRVAAIVIEPVQGEGGFVPAPVGYLQGLRRICDDEGIVLIFDEVQTGFCRTGAWGAYQEFGVIPDLSTWAKAMGGGLPIGAVIGKAHVIDGAVPGTIGSTFGGNPIACAASLAALAEMERLRLCERAKHIGRALTEAFHGLAQAHPEVVDVRGLGALMAMELCEDGDLGRPATRATAAIRRVCEREGLLLLSAGPHASVIRALPPLVITDEELGRALDILRRAFDEVLS